MIKQYQRIVDPGNGDCMQVAIASLLELPIDDVPKFIEFKSPYHELLQFILDNGYEFNSFLYNHPINSPNSNIKHNTIHYLKDDDVVGIKGLFYASVYSPKYYNWDVPWEQNYTHVTHAVICDKNYNIVHDPNPAYENIKEYPRADKLGYNGILSVMIVNEKPVK